MEKVDYWRERHKKELLEGTEIPVDDTKQDAKSGICVAYRKGMSLSYRFKL